MIRLGVLGGIRLWSDEAAEDPRLLVGDRRLALLVYLAMACPLYRRRESVIALLWPDQNTDQARHSLRQLLHMLREVLGADVLVAAGDEYVGVNGARLWCDARAFTQAAAEGIWERALELYAGPFCEGLSVSGARGFDRWLEQTRAELNDQAAQCARLLAHRCAASADSGGALHWGRRALRLAPDDEGVLRWLLQLAAREAGMAAALHIYEEHVRTMQSEFEVGPSADTIALVRNLHLQHG